MLNNPPSKEVHMRFYPLGFYARCYPIGDGTEANHSLLLYGLVDMLILSHTNTLTHTDTYLYIGHSDVIKAYKQRIRSTFEIAIRISVHFFPCILLNFKQYAIVVEKKHTYIHTYTYRFKKARIKITMKS